MRNSRSRPPLAEPDRGAAGFTLLELMIVVAVLGVLASISMPMYQSALQTARVAKARQELRSMSSDIDVYASRSGYYPLTLHEIGHGGRLDPWGQGYVYLNFSTGSGDNLDWAVAAGVLDPTVLDLRGGGSGGSSGSTSGLLDPGGGGSGGSSGGGGVLGSLRNYADNATPGSRQQTALTSMYEQVSARQTDPTLRDLEDLPGELEMVDDVEAVRRKDRFLFPLNTDYDLFSLGADRASAVQLGSREALDDVIRANNGGFFGLASEY